MHRRTANIGTIIATLLLGACNGGGGAAPAGGETAGNDASSSSPITFRAAMNGLPTTGMWKCDPKFADVNGDGFMDLAAIPRLGDGPHVWLGDGRGNWTDSSDGLDPGQPSCGGGIEIVDIDGDGHLDLAVADHCNGLFVYLGDGAGHWEMVTRELNPEDVLPEDDALAQYYVGAEDIDVADVNGDGHLDLLAGQSSEGGVHIYHGDGTGRHWVRAKGLLPEKGWANRVRFADMNNDGHPDVVATRGEGPRVWLNDGNGGLELASWGLPEPIMGGLYQGLEVGDVNGDGRLDIACANWVDGPEVYLQTEEGSYRKMPDVFPDCTGGSFGIDLADIDGDGYLDIVTSGRLKPDGGYVRGVFVLKGDGAGGWTWLRDCGLPNTGLMKTSGVTFADINGDGVLDVAAASGLKIETVPGPSEAAIPQRLLVWTGHVNTKAGEPVVEASATDPGNMPGAP